MAEFINWREHDLDLRYCTCADPENCRERVPGYVCRRDVRTVAKQVADDIDKALAEQVYGLARENELPPCTSPVGCIRMSAPLCRRSGKCLDTAYREGVLLSDWSLDWYGDVDAPDDLALARFEDEGGPPEPVVEEPAPRYDVLFGEGTITRHRRIGSFTGTSGR